MEENGFNLSEEEMKQLREIFFAESARLVESMIKELLELEKEPTKERPIQEIQRFVHTLKGDSSSVGLPALADLAHRAEDVLSPIKTKQRKADKQLIGLLFNCMSAFQKILQKSRGSGKEETPDLASLMDQLSLYQQKNQFNK